MKSLLVTGMLSMGFAHTGAFLNVWELPYVKDHFSVQDLERKLKKVTKWEDTRDALRNARTAAREETFDLYDNAPKGPVLEIKKGNYVAPWKKSGSKVTVSRRR